VPQSNEQLFTFNPETEESEKGTKALHDVGIVRSTFGYGGAQLGVAIRANEGKDAREGPHNERQPHTARALQHTFGGDKDSTPNHAANYHVDAIYECHLRLQTDGFIRLLGRWPVRFLDSIAIQWLKLFCFPFHDDELNSSNTQNTPFKNILKATQIDSTG
jgi:hypothetical protein